MQVGIYPIVSSETSMVFEFVSEGIRGSIPKMVIYSETHLSNFYILSFGDKDAVTGDMDDQVVSDNGDREKVLSTVASTLYIFTNKFPFARVFATGSTKARTRLYRMDISIHLEEIQQDFEVYGLITSGWIRFQ